MQIQVTSVEPVQVKKYKGVKVNYTTDSGKTAFQQILQFSPVYSKASELKSGDEVNVVMKKNDKDYWEWSSIEPMRKSETTSAPSATSKGNWETAEERAKKQLYIIRQSSIANAVELLKGDGTVADVLATADAFVKYVLNGNGSAAAAFQDMVDDIPSVD